MGLRHGRAWAEYLGKGTGSSLFFRGQRKLGQLKITFEFRDFWEFVHVWFGSLSNGLVEVRSHVMINDGYTGRDVKIDLHFPPSHIEVLRDV
jgi:hypothetical protein